MILDFSIECGPAIRIDDKQTDTRMTPEVAEDYLRRMREQAIHAYQEITAYNVALDQDPNKGD